MERALAKSYEYEIRNIGEKVGLTQERLNRYIAEMKTRKKNVQRLIHEFEKKRTIKMIKSKYNSDKEKWLFRKN